MIRRFSSEILSQKRVAYQYLATCDPGCTRVAEKDSAYLGCTGPLWTENFNARKLVRVFKPR